MESSAWFSKFLMTMVYVFLLCFAISEGKKRLDKIEQDLMEIKKEIAIIKAISLMKGHIPKELTAVDQGK